MKVLGVLNFKSHFGIPGRTSTLEQPAPIRALLGLPACEGPPHSVLDCLDHGVSAVRDLAAAARSDAELLGRCPVPVTKESRSGTENSLFRSDCVHPEWLAPVAGGFSSRLSPSVPRGKGADSQGVGFPPDNGSLRSVGAGVVGKATRHDRSLRKGSLWVSRREHRPERE